MKKNNLVTILVAAVIVGAVGFFGGMQYQKSQQGSFPGGGNLSQFSGGMNQRGTNKQGGTTGFRPVSGEITSIDQNTITVKTQDGSSKILIYSSSTKVNKTTEGSKSDLKIGEQVTAIGTESSDGTVTIQSISLGSGTLQGMPGQGESGQNKPPSAENQ